MFRVLLALLVTALAANAAETELICRCGTAHLLPQPVNVKLGRKYARDRFVDLRHLKLDVTPDFAKRTVSGARSRALRSSTISTCTPVSISGW